MATRGKSDRDYTIQIDGMRSGQGFQMLKSGGCVVQSARPSSARLSHSPVFDVPTGHPFLGEPGTSVTHMCESVCGTPKPAVKGNHYRKQTGRFWDPQFSKLIGIGPVADSQVGWRRR